jgi:hypothetical protein
MGTPDQDAQASRLLFEAKERLAALAAMLQEARNVLGDDGEPPVGADWRTLELIQDIEAYRSDRGWHPLGLGEARP